MAGANREFNDLFDDFQNDEFFRDAMYSFSWVEETSTSIDRETGESTINSTTHSCDAFLINPSKSERPSASVFKEIKAGDIAILIQQNELSLEPPLDTEVSFNGKSYTCKEIVPDTVGVSWKFLLRK